MPALPIAPHHSRGNVSCPLLGRASPEAELHKCTASRALHRATVGTAVVKSGAPRNQVARAEVPAKRASWRAQIEGQRVAASGMSRSKLSRRVATSSSAEFSNLLSTRVE